MSSTGPEDQRAASTSWKLAAFAILALATVLRVSNLGYGLDLSDPTRTLHNIQIDERGMVNQEIELLEGDWQPGKFLWRGTAPFYLAGVANAVVVWIASVASGEGWDATLAGLRENSSLVFYVHRWLVALTGILTVFVVMRLCRREIGPTCGLVAGLVLATAHLHVHVSYIAIVDVPWVLFATLAFERCLRVMRDPSRANFLMAGLWIGLAGSTKYPGALIGAMLLAAFFATRRAARKAGAPAPSWRLVAAGVGVSIATFLAFSPRLLLWPEEYVDAVQGQAKALDIFDQASAYVNVIVTHMRVSLGVGLGESVLVAIAYGYVVALRRGGAARRVALLALFFVPTAMIAQDPAPRFATGLLVGMVPVAAIGIDDLVRNRSRLVRFLVIAVAVAPGLIRSVSYGLILHRPDTRLELLDELAERAIAPRDIVAVGHRGLPELPLHGEGAFVSLLREMRRGKMTGADVLADPPDYLLRDLCSGEPEAAVWDPFLALAEAEYDEVFRVDGRVEKLEGRYPVGYYLLPRTFVPFSSPWKTTRPGPGLVLYRRRTEDAGA